MAARRRRLHPAAARHLVALGLYSVAALLLTWPLAARLTTHVPGDGIDDPALAWNLWLLKTQIVDHLNWDIFHIGWMFHPVGINLAFYTLTPLNLHYKSGRIKLEVGLAKGKKQHDKREAVKEREWNREQQRLVRNRTGSVRSREIA